MWKNHTQNLVISLYRELIVEYFNLLMGASPASGEYWEDTLQKLMLDKYASNFGDNVAHLHIDFLVPWQSTKWATSDQGWTGEDFLRDSQSV